MTLRPARLQQKSAYELTHNVKFHGKLIPFGAKVLFKPSNVREDDKPNKWGANAGVGVFAGYVIQPGYIWKGEILGMAS